MDFGFGNSGAYISSVHAGAGVEGLEPDEARVEAELPPLEQDCGSWTGNAHPPVQGQEEACLILSGFMCRGGYLLKKPLA